MRANPSKPDSYTLKLMWDAISDKPVASFGMVKGSLYRLDLEYGETLVIPRGVPFTWAVSTDRRNTLS